MRREGGRQGDNARARRGGGSSIRPVTFTQGTSAQRLAWFQRGIGSGRMADGNTFDARKL